MTIAVCLLSLFAVCTAAVALVDAIPAFRTWLMRIGIGSLPSDAARMKMRRVALRWLRKTPAVPCSDQTRFTLPERLRGTYKSRKVQAWQQGALLLGVSETGEAKAVKDFLQTQLTPQGGLKTAITRPDEALSAYAMLRAAEDAAAVRPAMDAVYDYLRRAAGEGTVPYDPHVPQIRFVDTVGMVCPFLTLYAQTYDVPEAQTLAVRQLSEYAENGLERSTGLPMHAFRTDTKAPLGICGWGRGCGWYALALAEMLRCGADMTREAKAFADSVRRFQQPSGAWSRQLLSDTGVESSATAMLGHLMAVLYRKTGQAQYLDSARRAKDALRTAVRRNGEVDYAQGDTKGIGFYSVRLVPAPAAQGFALLLTEEIA